MKLIPRKVTLGRPGTYEYKVKIETETGDFIAGIHFENRKISRAELKRWQTAIQIGVDSLSQPNAAIRHGEDGSRHSRET